jgi:hypothetical protein
MHPIFALSNLARSRTVRENPPLSICLHQAGHVCVARALGVPFGLFGLPDLNTVGAGAQDAIRIGDDRLPSIAVGTAGLSGEAVMSILLGGYAGELCLYDRDYVAAGGDHYTRVLDSAADAARLATILGLPDEPTSHDEIQAVLVAALLGLRYRPYDLLAGDLTGFRASVSRLHAAWEATGFRSFVVPENLLPPVR